MPDRTADTDVPQAPEMIDLRRLLEAARAGDVRTLPTLRAALDERPELWRQLGDLAGWAERAWVEMLGGQDLSFEESLRRQLAALKAELCGPSPTPLERLLAERAVACWMQVHHADAAAAQACGASLKQAAFAQKRQDAAHRRYLTALGALETLRRLLPATVESPASRDRTGAPRGEEPAAGAGPAVVAADAPSLAGPVEPASSAPLAIFASRDDAPRPVGPGNARRRSAS